MEGKELQLRQYLIHGLLVLIIARVCPGQIISLCNEHFFGECFQVPDFARNKSSPCKCYIDSFSETACVDDVLNDVRSLPDNVTLPFQPFPTLDKADSINQDVSSLGRYLRYVLLNAECRSIPATSGPLVSTVISSCPREATPLLLNDRCEDKRSFPPVTHRGLLDVTFQNIYCQQCQLQSSLAGYILWKSDIQCQVNDTSPKSWKEIERRLETGSCGYLYDRPDPLTSCNYEPVENLKSILKTECRICLEEKYSFNPFVSEIGDDDDDKNTLECLVCEVALAILDNECQPALASSDGLMTLFKLPVEAEVMVRLNGGLFKSSQLCEDDENFDVMFQKCRQFQCPSGMVAKKGECVDQEVVFVEAGTQFLPEGTRLLLVDMDYLTEEESGSFFGFSASMNLQDVVDLWKRVIPTDTILEISSSGIESSRQTYRIVITGMETVKVVNVIQMLSFSDSEIPETSTLRIQISNIFDEVMTSNTSVSINSYNQTKESGNCSNGQLTCVSEAEAFFLKEDMFAKVALGTVIKILPVDNILFNLTITAGSEHEIYFSEVCMCLTEPEVFDSIVSRSDSFVDLNCSFPIYQYEASEFRILDNGDLELLKQPISFEASRVHIKNDTSALVCYDPNKKVIFFNLDRTQEYLSWIFSGLSVFLLLVTLLSHLFFKQLRTVPGKLTMALSVFLIAGQTLLMLPDFSPSVCRYVAAFTHFSWLSVFLWMTCQAYNMFITFHPRFMTSTTSSTSTFWKYVTFSLVLPGCATIALLVMDAIPGEHYHVNYGVVSCVWMADKYGYYFTFFLPVALTLTFNLACFALTLCNIERSIATCEGVTGRKSDRNRCVIYIKLSSVMGFSWIFGLIASGVGVHALWYVYIVLNGLQGVFIFLSFTINTRTRQLFTSSLSRSKFTSLFKSDSPGNSTHRTASTIVSSSRDRQGV